MSVIVIKSLDELKRFLSGERKFFLYSAGFAAWNFVQSLKACNIQLKIEGVLVTNSNGNPKKFEGIPVIQYNKTILKKDDYILLTVSERFKEEIVAYLENCPAILVYPSPAVFYYDVYESIRLFADAFPNGITRLNQPQVPTERIVWSCWWQGEEAAPEIVKACWRSQRTHLADDIKHIIITKDNYNKYITIPDYVLDKFEKGKNLLAHLADFIRVCLLYKYGGVWLDSTVLLLEQLPEECWKLPLYTWKFDNTHFFSNTIWTTWFLAGQQGNVLFQFVMEAFLYYFRNYEQVKYYLTIDYFISICTNLVDGVLEQFKQIPYNNEKANTLNMHLNEPYSEINFCKYCEGTFLQKLNRNGSGYGKDSVYAHIIADK